MALELCQKEMEDTIKDYLALLSKRKQDPNNDETQKELNDLLMRLVAINEKQKVVLSELRGQTPQQPPSLGGGQNGVPHHDESETVSDIQQQEIDCNGLAAEALKALSPRVDLAEDSSFGNPNHVAKTDSDNSNISMADTNSISELSPFYLDEELSANSASNQVDHGISDHPSLKATDPRQWGISDFVPPEEFMHSIGLLTIRESDDVVCKRMDRYRRNRYAHIFSPTLWEKPESKRKKRDWLSSVPLSPPLLRKKTRGNSQPSSRQPSRPSSPTDGSWSSGTPPHPLSPSDSIKSPLPDEPCHFCNQKGAVLQCDGCGVCFHLHCIDLKEDVMTKEGWLCLTCVRLGLRSSPGSLADPSVEKFWKDEMVKKEDLLRKRAELTVVKQSLQEEQNQLTSSLEQLKDENLFLEERNLKTMKAVKQLKNFVSFFTRVSLPEDGPPPPAKPRPSRTDIRPISGLPQSTTILPSKKSGIHLRMDKAASAGLPNPRPHPVQISCKRTLVSCPSDIIRHPGTLRTKVVPNVSVEIVPKSSIQTQKSPPRYNQSGIKINPPTITLSKVNPRLFGKGAHSSKDLNKGSPIKLSYGMDQSTP